METRYANRIANQGTDSRNYADKALTMMLYLVRKQMFLDGNRQSYNDF